MASTSLDPGIGTTHDPQDNGGPPEPRAAVMAALALTSIVGPTLLLVLSHDGIHASNDSFSYLGAAHNLARGEGWTYPFGDVGAPVTLFPPLYPSLLAVPDAIGIGALTWAVWLNALLLGAFAFTVGVVTATAVPGAPGLAVMATLLVQAGTPTIIAYTHVWSETVFFPLVVVALAALSRHLTTRRSGPLVAAAMLSAAAMLTRYAGLSVFATSCALLLLWPGRRARERARATALYAGIAAVPSGLWLLRNLMVSGTLTGDNRLIHDFEWPAAIQGLRTLWGWLLPDRPDGGPHDVLVVVTILVAVALLAALLRAAIRSGAMPEIGPPAVVVTFAAFVAVHWLFILTANAFSSRAPPFDDRILGPAFAPLTIAILVVGGAIWRGAPTRSATRIALGGLGALLLVLSVTAAIDTMPRIYGVHVTSAAEYEEMARSLDGVVSDRAILFATRPNVAWFLIDRAVRNLPRSCRGGRVLPNPAWEEEVEELARDLGARPRQVIVFERSKECTPFSVARLTDVLDLRTVDRGGSVWVLEGPSERIGRNAPVG